MLDGGSAPEVVADSLVDAVGDALRALEVGPDAHLSLVLADDGLLHDLNRDHRGIDKPTDVLSFPFDRRHVPDSEGAGYLGDVVISVPYARRSAAASGCSLESELRLLAVHGLLHLIGHEDESEPGAARMREIEVTLGVREDA
ncbi:MAG: rRNA maturation RNase YbeY [Anaerolineae bacterium]